jgi:hypothetical protein
MRYSCETPGPGGYSAPAPQNVATPIHPAGGWGKPLTRRKKIAKVGRRHKVGMAKPDLHASFRGVIGHRDPSRDGRDRRRHERRVAELSLDGRGRRWSDLRESSKLMTANDSVGAAQAETASPDVVAPYSFQQLLNRQVQSYGPDLVLHVHVPKTGGITVATLLRQIEFFSLHFNMTTQDFFGIVPENCFFDAYRMPPPRRGYTLTGHYRLDHPIFRRLWMPHMIVTTLRHPVQRMLSYYNHTLRVRGNPWHKEVVGGMPFIEYARNVNSAFGPQYSFFDDTGRGTFAPSGAATAEECLNNLLSKVGLYGLTERFDEFAVLVGYFLSRPGILAVPHRNVTSEIENLSGQSKSALSVAERDELTDLVKDDIWFYEQATKEYHRRISDPRLRQILSQVLPLIQVCRESANRLSAVRHPEDPRRGAFEWT